jgi:hypothetical protein
MIENFFVAEPHYHVAQLDNMPHGGRLWLGRE